MGDYTSLSYDAENRLVGVSRTKYVPPIERVGDQVAGAVTAIPSVPSGQGFVYDGDGNRQ